MVKKQAEAGEAAWERNKVQLDSQWKAFEAQVKTYIETVGKQVQQQQAPFRDVAAAQVKAWREAADTIHDVAAKMAAARRADIDAAVKDEGGRNRGGSAIAEVESGRKRILGGAERGAGGFAQGLRPRQSGRMGRSQARGSSCGRLEGVTLEPVCGRSNDLKGSVIMATDAVVSRELKSLQEELSTSQRERASPTHRGSAASGTQQRLPLRRKKPRRKANCASSYASL